MSGYGQDQDPASVTQQALDPPASAVETVGTSESVMKTIKISLRTLSGEAPVVIEIAGSASVEDLKEAIQESEGVAVDRQNLMFQKRLVEDRSKSLEDCGIENGSTITLLVPEKEKTQAVGNLKIVDGNYVTPKDSVLCVHKWYDKDTRDGNSVYVMAHTNPSDGGTVFEAVKCLGGFKLKIVDGHKYTPVGSYLSVHKYEEKDTRDESSVYAMAHIFDEGTVFQALPCPGGFYLMIVDGNEYTPKGSYLAVHKYHEKDTRDEFSVYAMALPIADKAAVFLGMGGDAPFKAVEETIL